MIPSDKKFEETATAYCKQAARVETSYDIGKWFWHARDAEIADLKRQLAERDAATRLELVAQAVKMAALVPPCNSGYACKSLNENFSTYCPECKLRNAILGTADRGALDAYVQEKVDRERKEVSDWIDAYAKSEGLTITLETKTTEERIRALCTLLSAKAAHEQDRAVLAESEHWLNNLEYYADGQYERANKRVAANRAKVEGKTAKGAK